MMDIDGCSRQMTCFGFHNTTYCIDIDFLLLLPYQGHVTPLTLTKKFRDRQCN